MAMRYHWGRGIGHTYSHKHLITLSKNSKGTESDKIDEDATSEPEEANPTLVINIPKTSEVENGEGDAGESDSDSESNLRPPTVAASTMAAGGVSDDESDMDSEEAEIYATYHDSDSDT